MLLDRLERDDKPTLSIARELNAFNVFEVLRVQKRELHHSNFLAYLLTPSAMHGLHAAFLRAFLTEAIRKANALRPLMRGAKAEQWAVAQSYVVREWENTDIQIINPDFVLIIENKIDDKERGDQLPRYREQIERQYPDREHIFVYLTPEGDAPTDPQWIALSYTSILKVLENLLRDKRLTSGHETVFLLNQYVQILRRYVVTDPTDSLIKKARDVYRKHQRALDFLFEHKPSYSDSMHQHLRSLVDRDKGLRLDDTSPRYFRFVSKEWDRIAGLNTKKGWNEGSLLTVELETPPDAPRSLRLCTVIYTGSSPRLARKLHAALGTKKQTGNGEYLHVRIVKIPVPAEVNDDFNKDVARHLRSYVLEELPKITKAVRGAVKSYVNAKGSARSVR